MAQKHPNQNTQEHSVDTSKPQDENFLLGVGMMLFSGLGFALMNLFIRLSGPIPSMQKVFFRNLMVFIVSLLTLIHQQQKPAAKPLFQEKKDLGMLVFRSILGTIGLLANFYAVDHLPLANASVLNKLSPFFTVIFSALFLKDRVNKAQVAGIICAFVGVIVLTRPVGMEMSWTMMLPILIAILGGIAAGAAYTTVRYLGQRGMNGSFIICFFAGFSVLVTAPQLIFDYYPMTGKQVLYLVLVGISALAGQYGITYAYRFAAPPRISIFDYSSVLFSTLLGLFVLDQIPTASTIWGIVIIFAAFLIMFLYNRQLAKKKA